MLTLEEIKEIPKTLYPADQANEIIAELCETCETLFSLAAIKAAKIDESVKHLEQVFSTARQAALDFNPARKTPADAG